MRTSRLPLSLSRRRAAGALRASLLALLGAAMAGSPSVAREAVTWETRSFADMSLDELLNESVTSVSKREQRLGDAAASVSVLTNDDLRRSGFTNIADALRLVPGMNVGSVNAHDWAVSARGFNNLYANKLLVLVDGRAVYTPLFAGTYWDLQPSLLEDVDRVEVVRGPGATVWGANAVNGVINVLTRSARDTQGTLLYGGGGDFHARFGGARYGGRIGENTYYRVFASFEKHDDFPLPPPTPSPFIPPGSPMPGNGWRGWQTGLRLDHYPDSATHLTWQTDLSHTKFDEGASHGYSFSSLGRWTRQLSDRSSLEVQAYVDRVHRDEALRSAPVIETADVTLQHTFGFGERNDLIWGLGYRFHDVHVEATNFLLPVRNGDFDLQLFSAFLQDEFKLIPEKLTLTAGVKFEHNDFTGKEYQPSVRAVFKPSPQQTVWAAWSRAARTPSALEDKDVFAMVFGPPVPGPDGNLYAPIGSAAYNPKSEVLFAHELGWRFQPHHRVSVDLSAFYNRYERIIGFSPVPIFIPGVPIGQAITPWVNLPDPTTTYGGEASVTATISDHWRVTAGYSLLHVNVINPLFGSDNLDPKRQATLRLAREFRNGAQLDLQVRHVGAMYLVPSYVTADVRLAYRVNNRLELSVAGQNLLDPQHPEQGFVVYSIPAEVPRRFYAKATWRF